MWYWGQRRWRSSRRGPGAAGLLLALMAALPAAAGSPEWLKAAARTPVPEYPPDTDAVVLFQEEVISVKQDGEIRRRYRRAVRILRPPGGSEGTVRVYFDSETPLTYLKGWTLPRGEKEYEVKEKETVEATPFSGELYVDTRVKILELPAPLPGNVVGYEYEQRGRPFLLDDTWWVADTIPVVLTRYILELPKGWEFETHWLNREAAAPRSEGSNRWVWEAREVPAVALEPAMPHWRAVAARMVVNLLPATERPKGQGLATWQDVGRWYWKLAEARRGSTPEIRQKAKELTAGASDGLERLRALGEFVQREVRYVAIEIGIGGYQPHAAQQVFANRYGDCKDKATLLMALLGEAGLESYYVLVHSRRGVVRAPAPSVRSFNHVILAVRLPEEAEEPTLYAQQAHPRLGRLLFFDPTDTHTPFGYLPAMLQGSQGLLVGAEGGELVELPLLGPTVNRLLRSGEFVVTPGGALEGAVQEMRWGAPAIEQRWELLQATEPERVKVVEKFLSRHLGGFVLQGMGLENLENAASTLVLRYRFKTEQYAKPAGELLLLRPRVVGLKGSGLMEVGERKHPVEFDTARSETDVFEIALPEGYEVDELPPAVEVATEFAEYRSRVEAEGTRLRYQRDLVVKQVWIPAEKLEELKTFLRRVAADERNQVVLRRRKE